MLSVTPAGTAPGHWPAHLPVAAVRFARASAALEECRRFYEGVVGLDVLFEFHDHDGYDGVVLGLPDRSVQLELIRHRDKPTPEPDSENALVLYVRDGGAALRERVGGGVDLLVPENPYWARLGAFAIADPDGWQVLLVPSSDLDEPAPPAFDVTVATRSGSTVSSDDGLYMRGCATLVASWEAYTRGARGAMLLRRPGVAVAAFPHEPERSVYNNALLDRGLGPAARAAAIDAITATYAAAGVESFAAWVHESDDDLRADLADRGFRLDTWTRAMGMPLDELRPVPVDPRVEVADLDAHLRTIGLPDLLAGVDRQRFRAVVAPGVEPVSTGLSFDHEGDCGIFNVSTAEGARRRGLGSAVTAALLRGATGANCLTASLQSTPMAAALYTAMGFRDLGRLLEYVPPT